MTILAATDLSAPARHAASRATHLAHEIGAQVKLVHVLSQGALDDLRELLGVNAAPVEHQLVERAREELARLAASLEAPLGRTPDIHLATGTVLREVLDYAEAVDADLLVLGARGESFMRHALLGSTAERLLRKTRRPILVVKRTQMDRYRRVLVPVDFSSWSGGSLELARAIAPRAELVLLHAFDVPFEGKLRFAGVADGDIHQYRIAAKQTAMQHMKQLAATVGLDPGATDFCVLHGDASRHVVEQEQDRGCDLIVLGKHGRNAFEELLLGSVTKHVLAESNCDVAVAAPTGNPG